MDEVDDSNMSFEPMDVDLSNNSASVMDISSSSNVSPRRSTDKYHKYHKYHKYLQKTAKPVKRDSCETTKLDKVSPRKSTDNNQKLRPETAEPISKNSCDTAKFDEPTNITIKQEKQSSSGTVIKKYHIKLERQKVQKSYFSIHVVGSALVFLGVALLVYSVYNLKCSVDLDIAALKDSLSKNVFGQQFAVEDIVDALNVKTQSKILFLYGGTGVGKTFSISFILNQLLPSSNIYHYTMPTFKNSFSIELMFGLTICKNSMVIVDDLTANDDVLIKSHIKKLIEKSEDLAKNITIILIFNCDVIHKNFIKKCDRMFHENLMKTFSDVAAIKTFIKFNPLSEEHLRKCLEREIGHVIKETDMVRIMANFNVSLDGCKGVFHKIRFLYNI